MTHSLARIFFSMTVLLAATSICAQTRSDGVPKITLKTDPEQLRAGQEFELIWRVSVENAQILEVFADCTDAFGPEHKWEHDGNGAFESRVKHVEATPGLKEYELWAKIRKGGEFRFAGESFKFNVAAKEGDKDLESFLSWMKRAGYSEDVIKVYAHDGANPVVRKEWDKYFSMRKQDSAYRDLETMPVVFVDLLATEQEAINEPMAGRTPELKAYMERMYGKAFGIEYLEQRVSYGEQFGKPIPQKNDEGKEWLKFDPTALNRFARETAKRLTEERKLPPNAVIIRWAAKRWKQEGKELVIQDHTGSSPAFSGMDFGLFGLGAYAHEWGHGLGLGHMFTVGPGSYSSRAWGLECIMNHTYVGYSNREVGRLLSPLPRYALEPKNGYLDQKTFASTYSEAMAGTDHLGRRLEEIRNGGTTVVSDMTWSTPWDARTRDSVICKGLQNRDYEIKELELQQGIEPGSYSLFVDKRGGSQWSLVLRKDGRQVATTSLAWMTKVSYEDHHKISFDNYLSLAIGRSNNRGGSTLAGIGKLLNGKPLVVP